MYVPSSTGSSWPASRLPDLRRTGRNDQVPVSEQLGERSADRSAVAGRGISGFDKPGSRALLGTAAIVSGMAPGWLTSGNGGVLAGMAVLLAAGNGYGKAYSP
jgi:hypothetical protein